MNESNDVVLRSIMFQRIFSSSLVSTFNGLSEKDYLLLIKIIVRLRIFDSLDLGSFQASLRLPNSQRSTYLLGIGRHTTYLKYNIQRQPISVLAWSLETFFFKTANLFFLAVSPSFLLALHQQQQQQQQQ
jgi:hypothetical protein